MRYRSDLYCEEGFVRSPDFKVTAESKHDVVTGEEEKEGIAPAELQLQVEDMTAREILDGEAGPVRTRGGGEEEGTSGTDGVELEVREDMAEKLFDLRSTIRVKVAGCTDDQTMESGGFLPRLPRQPHLRVEEQRREIERVSDFELRNILLFLGIDCSLHNGRLLINFRRTFNDEIRL